MFSGIHSDKDTGDWKINVYQSNVDGYCIWSSKDNVSILVISIAKIEIGHLLPLIALSWNH